MTDQKRYVLYHPELKMQFMEQFKGNVKYLPRLKALSEMQPSEAKLDKDLGEMTRQELLDAFQQLPLASYMLLIDRVQYIRRYLEWYSEHIKPVSIQTYNIGWRDIDLTESFRRCLITSIQEIPDCFDAKYPPEDGWLDQAVYVLNWYGVDLRDMCLLGPDDYKDTGDMICVRTPKQELIISDSVAMNILRKYTSFHAAPAPNGDTFVRSNTTQLFYLRTRLSKADEERELTERDANNQLVYHRDTLSRERHMDPNIRIRFRNDNLKTAHLYQQVIEQEDALGRTLTNEELQICIGRKTDRSNLAAAYRAGVATYRKILS